MPAVLARALSDDLVIANRAYALGLRVMTPRALRLPTPLGGSLSELWHFGRRQYQIVHIYRSGVWWLALALCTGDLAARAVLLVAACALEPIALAALAALGLLGSITTVLRRDIGLRLGVTDLSGHTAAQHFLAWCTLPSPIFHASMVWAAAIRSPVSWMHVRYTVDRRGWVVQALRPCRAR